MHAACSLHFASLGMSLFYSNWKQFLISLWPCRQVPVWNCYYLSARFDSNFIDRRFHSTWCYDQKRIKTNVLTALKKILFIDTKPYLYTVKTWLNLCTIFAAFASFYEPMSPFHMTDQMNTPICHFYPIYPQTFCIPMGHRCKR